MKKIIKGMILSTGTIAMVAGSTAAVVACGKNEVIFNDDPNAVRSFESIVNDYGSYTINNKIPVDVNLDMSFIDETIINSLKESIDRNSIGENLIADFTMYIEGVDKAFTNTTIGADFITKGDLYAVATSKATNNKVRVKMPQLHYYVRDNFRKETLDATIKLESQIQAKSVVNVGSLGVIEIFQKQTDAEIATIISQKVNEAIKADPIISKWLHNAVINVDSVNLNTSVPSSGTLMSNVSGTIDGLQTYLDVVVFNLKFAYVVYSTAQIDYSQAIDRLINSVPKINYQLVQGDKNFSSYIQTVDLFLNSARTIVPNIADFISSVSVSTSELDNAFDVSTTGQNRTSGNIKIITTPVVQGFKSITKYFNIKYDVVNSGTNQKDQSIHDNEINTLQYYLSYFRDSQKPFEIRVGNVFFGIQIALENMVNDLIGTNNFFRHLANPRLITTIDGGIFNNITPHSYLLKSGDIQFEIGSSNSAVKPRLLTFNVDYVVRSATPDEDYETAVQQVIDYYGLEANEILFQTNENTTREEIYSQIQLSIANYINSSLFLRTNLLYKEKDDISITLSPGESDIDLSAPINNGLSSVYSIAIKPATSKAPLGASAFDFHYQVLGADSNDTKPFLYGVVKQNLRNHFNDQPIEISSSSITSSMQQLEITQEIRNYIGKVISTPVTDPNNYEYQLAVLFKTALNITSKHQFDIGTLEISPLNELILPNKENYNITEIENLTFTKKFGNPKVLFDKLPILVVVKY